MGGGVRRTKWKKGFVFVLSAVLVDELHGVVGDGVGVVEALVLDRLLGDVGVVESEGLGRVEVPRSGDGAEEAVETTLARPVVFVLLVLHARLVGDVPFAGHVGGVAVELEGLGQGDALFIEVAAVARLFPIGLHASHARLVRVETGEQGGAGGTAAGTVVELGEDDALLSHAVERRRLDLGAEATDVREAHVVGHDEHDVRTVGGEE